MQVSVCITVFNEEAAIAQLIESLLLQSKKPDEIVIIDAGSIDKTVEIIKHYQKKDRRIKLIIEKGSCAHGRNTSIELAKNEIIAITDAGCIAHKDWLKMIIEPFKHPNVRLVAGFYDMPAETAMNQAINVFHGIPPERFDPLSFIPSARSVAFRKDLWEEVGGFDESLVKAGEDTKFFHDVLKKGVKIIRVKEARVVWKEAGNLSLENSLKKFYQYAKGDAQTGIWWHSTKHLASHNLKLSLILLRYFLGIALLFYSFIYTASAYYLLIAIFLYLFWSIWKWRDVIKNWRARLWLPVIQISSDIAVMAGFLSGLWLRVKPE